MTSINLELEAQLSPEISFPHAISPHSLAPRTIFMTGATGFLGIYLLHELLSKTAADIVCLVRAPDTVAARARMMEQMQGYGLDGAAFASRIRPVLGDLAQPRFGLSEEEFEALAAQTDSIYHSAGWTNMLFPYSRLKSCNVSGTIEILRLAGLVYSKPVHFVSSMAVFFNDANKDVALLKETDAPKYDPSLKSGYSQSKWVADRLVAEAQRRGLPACIYRPVRIMGHSRTGAMNEMNDLLPMLLKSCILLGKYPTLDIEVTFVPVDFVSQAMVHLATQEWAWGRGFHFFNPAPISWERLISVFRSVGYRMEAVSYEQWRRALSQPQTEGLVAHKNILGATLLGLSAPHFLFYKRPPLDASFTQQGLSGTQIACAPADDALVGTYIKYWQRSGYLPVPSLS